MQYARMAACLGLIALASYAQGTKPRKTAQEYPAHIGIPGAEMGAEYLVRSIGSGETSLVARDYLVVEVAVFPKKGETVTLDLRHFLLRLNGKKPALQADSPGMVANSLKYPDWERHSNVTVGGGMGDGGVMIGGPGRVSRFPGDRPDTERLPNPPQAPSQSQVEKEEKAAPDEIAVTAALPEGPTKHPVSGLLYFSYSGKTKKIRSLELLYQSGPDEPIVLRLP